VLYKSVLQTDLHGENEVFKKSLDEKKDYLANIAGEVFFEKGYKESSLQDVSTKGEISKAGIYHYFKTKEDILSYILLTNTEKGITALNDCIKQCERNALPPQEACKELVRTYARFLLENRKTSMLVLRERHQLTGENRNELLKREREIFQLLRSQVEKVPELNDGYDKTAVCFHLIAMNHWMGYWFKESGKCSMEELIEQNINMVFNGLMKKGC
jgi:TetR/AcrR family transcriptional regulator, cholesterol catabolism regulator